MPACAPSFPAEPPPAFTFDDSPPLPFASFRNGPPPPPLEMFDPSVVLEADPPAATPALLTALDSIVAADEVELVVQVDVAEPLLDVDIETVDAEATPLEVVAPVTPPAALPLPPPNEPPLDDPVIAVVVASLTAPAAGPPASPPLAVADDDVGPVEDAAEDDDPLPPPDAAAAVADDDEAAPDNGSTTFRLAAASASERNREA